MTATTILRQASIGRAAGTLILVAALAFGSGVAATVTLEGASRGPVGEAAAVQAAPTFDAVTFRAEERAGSYAAPTFDVFKSRADERTGSGPQR
jgi:hypothetical protein